MDNVRPQTLTDEAPLPLPQSDLYVLRTTPNSGRGVFATTTIPVGTTILNTSAASSSPHMITPLSPIAWLLQRPYRKEACATCFAYNRGREWKLKIPQRDCGVVFCSDPCRDEWIRWNSDVGMMAWEALEKGVKEIMKRGSGADLTQADEVGDVQTNDGNGHHDANHGPNEDTDKEVGSDSPKYGPSEAEINESWEQTQLIREVIHNARTKTNPSKNERKVLRNVLGQGGDPDLMYYMLTAVTTAWNVHQRLSLAQIQQPQPDPISSPSPSSSINITTLLSPLFSLTPTLSAYNATHTSLHLYTTSYLYLCTLLPLDLYPYLTPTLAHNLNTRAAHNAFSIRPPPTTDGDDSGEFLGWAVFPSASFFNHSCAPTLSKKRRGRGMEFFVADTKDVRVGEELCISYLGGEEKDLGVRERRARLSGEWGFWCCCVRCVGEAEEEEGSE